MSECSSIVKEPKQTYFLTVFALVLVLAIICIALIFNRNLFRGFLNSDLRRPSFGYSCLLLACGFCLAVRMCFSVPPEGGALSSVSVPERGVGPGERDSARSLLS